MQKITGFSISLFLLLLLTNMLEGDFGKDLSRPPAGKIYLKWFKISR
jgi:hypothetical protein